MNEVWGATAELAVGLLLCFFGHRLARLALALLGAVVGYLLGGAAYTALLATNPALLKFVSAWAFAVAGAVLFGWLAYSFYVAGVLVLLGSLGWGIGVAVAAAFGWGEVLVVIGGLVGAAVLAGAGSVLNLPRVLIIVTTALVGASAVVSGLQVFASGLPGGLASVPWIGTGDHQLLWWAVQAGLVVIGALVQLRQGGQSSLRAAYAG